MGRRFEQFTKENINHSISRQKHFQRGKANHSHSEMHHRSSRMAETGDAVHTVASMGNNWKLDTLLVGA